MDYYELKKNKYLIEVITKEQRNILLELKEIPLEINILPFFNFMFNLPTPIR